MGNKTDDQLLHWDKIKSKDWRALLLGNGFSVNIWQGFNYRSLFDVAKTDDIDFKLTSAAVELFNKKDTENFEDILNLLIGAILADKVIEGEQKTKLTDLYEKIRDSLISAVQESHVAPELVDTEHISNEMRKYNTIFTTNYDLIPYWAIMNHNTAKFRDYFWNGENLFDSENTDIWGSCTRILYLHGALHILGELEGDKAWKNKAADLNLLEQFPETFEELYRPLFITEGDAKHKLTKIYGSEYLKFAYSELRKHNKSLVVLGHSLEPAFDQHLIDAISEWDKRKIAISVWPGMSSHNIVKFKARINESLNMHKLYYFDSTSHPLGTEALNHE